MRHEQPWGIVDELICWWTQADAVGLAGRVGTLRPACFSAVAGPVYGGGYVGEVEWGFEGVEGFEGGEEGELEAAFGVARGFGIDGDG